MARGLFIVVASLVAEHGLYGMQAPVAVVPGLSSCGSQALEKSQQLWYTGFIAPWHMGSSWTRDRTCVSRIGRQILYH